jgi:hypothetical protein
MKNRLDAQLILGIFRRPLHVKGVSRPIIRRYNRVYTTTDTYYSGKRLVPIFVYIRLYLLIMGLDTPERHRV